MTHQPLILALLALCAIAAPMQAAKPKKRNPKKPTDTELIEQAQSAFNQYRPDEARNLLSQIADETEASTDLSNRIDRMDAMLQRVAAIEVIDSINIPASDLLSSLHISPSCGAIFNATELEETFPVARPASAYSTQGELSLIWGGPNGLLMARQLTDGSWEEAQTYGANLNAGATANYPFLMPDGITLYYATNGNDALGGYDIYVTRRDGENFHTPQNMGMPFNSPANDFLLAIDEESGFGFWVSDRNDPTGNTLTVYYFIPSDVRVNVPVTDPNIGQLAALSNIKLTQKSKHDDLLARIHQLNNEGPQSSFVDAEPDFVFELPNGRTLTRWDQIANPEMRRLMENYVDALQEYKENEHNLEQLRADYAKGHKELEPNILNLERKLAYSHSQIKNLSNRVINAAMP